MNSLNIAISAFLIGHGADVNAVELDFHNELYVSTL